MKQDGLKIIAIICGLSFALVAALIVGFIAIIMLSGPSSELQLENLVVKLALPNQVVYAIVDIPEGTLLKQDQIVVRKLESNKIPQDAIRFRSLFPGRVTKYGISEGQIVGNHDFMGFADQLDLIVDKLSIDFQESRYPDAQKACDEGIRLLEKRLALTYYAKASIQNLESNPKDALADLETSIRFDPTSIMTYLRRIEVAQDLKLENLVSEDKRRIERLGRSK